MDQTISNAVQDFNQALEHLKQAFSRLQAGRASASLLDGVQVESYGSMQPLKAVGNISVPDAKTIQIQPWDKSMLGPIEKAIASGHLNLNPVNDGNMIRIVIPQLTEDRRRDLTKQVHKLAEDAKISVRNSRQKAHTHMKEMQKNSEITEDDLRSGEKRLQEKVDNINKQIDELAKAKESDIMTI